MTGDAAASFVSVHRGHLLLFAAWVVCFAAAYLWNLRRSAATSPRRGVLLWATALTSVTGGVVHLAVTREHFAESALYGWFFLLLAAAQIAWAGRLLLRPSRRLLLAGAVASVAVVLLWLATRTVGIPLGPAAGETEPVGALDLLASTAELFTALCAVASLRAATPVRSAPQAVWTPTS